MATGATAPVAVYDRQSVNTDIARLILQGYGADGIAGKLEMDRDTARRHCAAVKAEWASELADPNLLRAQLASMALDVYRKCTEWADQGDGKDLRHRSPLMRVAVSAINSVAEFSGLRLLRIDVGSSQLAAILAQMAGTAGLAALSSGDRAVVAGEWREVVAGESGGDGDKST